MKSVFISYLCGYSFSIFGSIFLVKWVLDAMWEKIEEREGEWQSRIVGFLDVFLYTTSWWLARYEFIGIWLVFKAAGRWNIEEEKAEKKYNPFILGSGLSLSYGIVGGMLIKTLLLGVHSEEGFETIICLIGLLIITFILWFWLKIIVKKPDHSIN